MGFLSRLFGQRQCADVKLPAATSDPQTIIHAYAAVLGSRKSIICDVSTLPFPKNQIKAALIIAMQDELDPQVRDQMKTGYMHLADFQEGVGSQSYEVTPQDAVDPQAFKKRIDGLKPAFTEMPQIVAAEAQGLTEELKALGL